MAPSNNTTRSLASKVPENAQAGIDRLRARMVRDLELYLSYALERMGGHRVIEVKRRDWGCGVCSAGRRCA